MEEQKKKRRNTCFHMQLSVSEPNVNLETTLSVHTILMDLKLGHLNPIFEREEVVRCSSFGTFNLYRHFYRST